VVHVGETRLVIVRRGHFATFELLCRTFSDDPSVQIVWDRRREERRRTPDAAAEEERRRSKDRRRVPPMQWRQLNYVAAFDASRKD
jgi:hypothetical protein